MRKIIFTGQLQDIEFAKRKIYDYSNKESKRVNIPELKQRLKDVKESYSKKSLTVREQGILKHKQGLNQIEIRGMRLNSRAYPKVDRLKTPISERLERYKFNKEKQKEFDEVDNWLENRKKRNQPTPTQSVTKTSVLQPKELTLGNKAKGSLNKAGLVGAGLLTAGAIGYTIYRKTRKDKGKKRGKYAK